MSNLERYKADLIMLKRHRDTASPRDGKLISHLHPHASVLFLDIVSGTYGREPPQMVPFIPPAVIMENQRIFVSAAFPPSEFRRSRHRK